MLDRRLSHDTDGKKMILRFFNLKLNFPVTNYVDVSVMNCLARRFPNTPVDLIRQCFEALQMHDLVDFLEKAVKPISLPLILSAGEVETLRTGNLPTKSHNNVVVLVVNDSADKDLNQKIEGFFKELNSQNNVTVIGSSCSEENREKLNYLKSKHMHLKRLSKVLENLQLATSKRRRSDREAKGEVAQLEKEMKKNKPLLEEFLKENKETKKIMTSTMDNWIQNQGWYRVSTV